MRFDIIFRLFAFIVLLSFLADVAYGIPALTKLNTDMANLSFFWTKERMQNAKSLDIPFKPQRFYGVHSNQDQSSQLAGEIADGASPLMELSLPNEQSSPTRSDFSTASNAKYDPSVNFSSSRLVPISADRSYPYTTVGKLFFTIPGKGNFNCSAAVIRHRIIVTAGHCVHSGSNGAEGFYTNWLFVPAYRDGTSPLLNWTWNFVLVSPEWTQSGGVLPNRADYAFIELKDKDIFGTLRRINSITGYLGYQTLATIPNHAHLLGYPCNLDNCLKMHQVTSASVRQVDPNNAEYGSDMGAGSDGGPWVQNFGVKSIGQSGGNNPGMNRIIGIASYQTLDPNNSVQGSSILNADFARRLKLICQHRLGNCNVDPNRF